MCISRNGVVVVPFDPCLSPWSVGTVRSVTPGMFEMRERMLDPSLRLKTNKIERSNCAPCFEGNRFKSKDTRLV